MEKKKLTLNIMNEPTKSLTNHMNELKEKLYSTVNT